MAIEDSLSAQIIQQIGEQDMISVAINLVAANGIEEVMEVTSPPVLSCLSLHENIFK